ncbi:hypothetical protein P168DRAFT_306248 [Aspergillus campestris IBT 28561]|uniref:Helix-turn-helix domain-containing protein n=1 Tax=Aspergillus campestris (strain IBT 28561) TaxID=1392248 RepID=A0A2I1CWM7_ASPC2|nr:uncharacterized protein P168DRAFT_306248 [Aspergillus campestris IBT 28561]PKY02034.1 hypothetical protein P168DRAFT_306248 [Aspergillus campestris IBT 28561]
MGSAASKPAKSAAQAASRRQYPKKPSAPPTSSPASAAPRSQPHTTPRSQQPQAPPAPPPSNNINQTGPTYHSKEQPSTSKSNAIDLDGRDPDFAASLRHIGPVNPHPTFSNSSVFPTRQGAPQQQHQQPGRASTVFPPATNPALLTVTARQQLTKAAEQETDALGRSNFAGREFLDTMTIRQVLNMRDRQGLPPREIERLLRLKKGVVERLGEKGIVGVA